MTNNKKPRGIFYEIASLNNMLIFFANEEYISRVTVGVYDRSSI